MSNKMDNIKESVCKFYLDNKNQCNTCYYNAESKDFVNFYHVITDDFMIRKLLLQVSIVVLTANKYEKNILHHNIYNKCSNSKILKFSFDLFPQRESTQETYAYWFKWDSYTVLHVEAQSTGSYTIGGSADIVRYIIQSNRIFPTAIISLGICFGTDETKYNLGDVVISDKIYPYFIGSKINETGYFVNDDNMFRTNSNLRKEIKSLIDANVFSNHQTQVYFSNYITGEAVVSNKIARDAFTKITTQNVIAGEMEGYGLFKECHGSNYTIPCLLIKSICDWAVMKNFDSQRIFEKIDENGTVNITEQKTLKDRIQAYSAQQSFDILNEMIERKVFEDSLYAKTVNIIKSIRGKAVFASRIKSIIINKAIDYSTNLRVSDTFVVDLIRVMLNENILASDPFVTIEDNFLSEQFWNHSFSIIK